MDYGKPDKKTLKGADCDIVMTKWIGLEGTAIIAEGSFDALRGRYPKDIVETAAGFVQYLSVEPETAIAAKYGAGYVHVLHEGGIFWGLWKLASDNGVGLAADLNAIPVRQETIEICEFFKINPYKLLSGGSLLMTAENGGRLVRALNEAGIPASVIGYTTSDKARVIRRGQETRYLDSTKKDSIHTYNRRNL